MMKTYTIELILDLPEGWGKKDIEMSLYRDAFKHYPYDWGIGDILKVEDVEE